MVNIDSEIVNDLITEMATAHPTANVSGVYVNAPSSFPHISVIEADNYSENLDSSDTEKFARIVYEVNVYSNSEHPKTEARSILNTINNFMYRKNFTRTSCRAVPNASDSTIYRMYARYEVVSDGTNLYRR